MKKFCIFVSIIFVSLFTGCGKDKGITGTSTELTTEATTTESDVVVEIDDTTEEVTVVVPEEEKPSVVPGEAHSGSTGSAKPATTEATGNVKPATTEATTEAPQTAKPATTEAPAQPTKPEKPATTEAPQHVHNYNKWVVDQAAYDETVVVKEAWTETVEHSATWHNVDGVQCNGCGAKFTSYDGLNSHPCGDEWGYGGCYVRVYDTEAWTETINHPAETKTVHHDEVGHWECSCGAGK